MATRTVPSLRAQPTLRSRWRALGCDVELVTADVGPTRHETAVERMRFEVAAVDLAASRFRADSELSRVNRAAGGWQRVSAGFLDLLQDSLAAAVWSDGLVVPTLGRPLSCLGYDRDISLLPLRPRRTAQSGWFTAAGAWPEPSVAADWRSIEIDRDEAGPGRVRIPSGIALDLGSIGKAAAADRIARTLASTTLSGFDGLVNLGGDIAVIGSGPRRWEIAIDESGRDESGRDADRAPRTSVRIVDGGLATSSTAVRVWSQHGVRRHHILDPRTGLPATPHWRCVSVHADSCRLANAASTAAIVLAERAPAWLAQRGITARLVSSDLAGAPSDHSDQHHSDQHHSDQQHSDQHHSDQHRADPIRTGGWPADVAPAELAPAA